MDNHRTTERYGIHELDRAAFALRNGSVIAFPTETVYGLGADAFNPSAIAQVFQAKGRPPDNPLIVHISDMGMLLRVAPHVPAVAHALIDAFWPGPLTLLLPKSEAIPSSVTAGLPTVAIRMPRDPIALELIRHAGVPIVAPSANLSGRPSATTWQAVAEDLDGRIDGIVCGPPTQIGLESTVLDILQDPPRILRHGGLEPARLKKIVPHIHWPCHATDRGEEIVATSPGMKHRHYQPVAQVRILYDSHLDENAAGKLLGRRGWIGIHPPVATAVYAMVIVVNTIEDYAAQLFETFRKMDHEGIDTIDCESVPLDGIGLAIMDRLARASSKS